MDIGSIFLILAVLIPVVIFVSRPLMERKATAITVEEHDYSALLAERDRILNALQELEFDYTLGKIPETQYPAQRASLMRYGADLLRQIDEYEGQSADSSVDDRLEAAIAERKAVTTTAAATVTFDPDDELEALISARRRTQKSTGQTKTGGFCPQCGNCVQESDRFCPKCGNALS
jgi:hypothetical protein